MADHVIHRYRRIFVRHESAVAKTHCRDAGAVHHSADACFLRRPNNRFRSGYVCGIHFIGIGRPEPVIGRNMKHELTTGNGGLKSSSVTQVTLNQIRTEVGYVVQPTCRTNKETEIGAGVGKRLRDMSSYKPRSSCYEYFQTVLLPIVRNEIVIFAGGLFLPVPANPCLVADPRSGISTTED